MTAFVPGLALARALHDEGVAPVLAREFPGLPYATARLGVGSDVLGFDTEMSADHDWGPRLELFLREADFERHRDAIDAALRRGLPRRVLGHSTSFTEADAHDDGTRFLVDAAEGAVNHRVEITAVRRFVRGYLGWDPRDDPGAEIAPADWLTFPEQKLRTLTDGPVFHDAVGVASLRARLAYYPDDVWRHQLAAAWERLADEEHLMGRAGSVGDELGSAVIGARLVRDVMRLGFLMERTYAPYAKWFGTAFARLTAAPELTPHLREALAARDWRTRESHLVPAYEIVARMHDALALTPPMPTSASRFYGRPFRVMAMQGFAEALLRTIRDERVRALATRPVIGGVDFVSDNTKLLSRGDWQPRLRALYE